MSEYLLVNVESSLSLDVARRITDGALASAREAGLLPLTVGVVDAGGHLVHFAREDGCGIARQHIALAKARAALGMGVDSGTIGQRLADRPAFVASIAAATHGQFAAVPGGVLILNDEKVAVGAIGISGDASARDEYAAIAGVRQAGFTSHPAEPADGWQNASL
ncbi:MAG: heme-binding protein [Gammaproteobacteria bacterium]|nr:heme-binding protein [Gammaproteobacteria bacterium]